MSSVGEAGMKPLMTGVQLSVAIILRITEESA